VSTNTKVQYLTPRELAEFLTEQGMPGVSEERVRAWIREHKIPSVGLPGRRRVVHRDVAADILAGKYGEEPPA